VILTVRYHVGGDPGKLEAYHLCDDCVEALARMLADWRTKMAMLEVLAGWKPAGRAPAHARAEETDNDDG